MTRLELLKSAMSIAYAGLDDVEALNDREYDELKSFFGNDWAAMEEKLAKDLLIEAANNLP